MILNLSYFFLLTFSIFLILPSIKAHALLEFPCQRGALNPNGKYAQMCDDRSAPDDIYKFFPAGDKSTSPGAGRRSLQAAGGQWTPYEPFRKDFVWRSGVCGDLKDGPQDHLRGGKYYHDGKIVAEYREGGILEATVNVIAHHNGFIQFYVCDVAHCNGEISPECFTSGHCYSLNRAPNRDCDSGMDKECGPIDENHPERWYLPCSKGSWIDGDAVEKVGGKKMQFLLPKGLTCEHCVLQWYHVTANFCNPRDVIEYFDGPNRPLNWGQCPGQAGAKGGVTRSAKDCGGDLFSEEYFQCADIRINPSSSPVQVPDYTETVTSSDTNTGAFTRISITADDQVIVEDAEDGQEVDVRSYSKVALQAVRSDNRGPVDFYVNGDKVWTDNWAPFFMYGNMNSIPHYTKSPPLNEMFTLEVKASDGSLKRRMKLIK